jgi:hypothetical protein
MTRYGGMTDENKYKINLFRVILLLHSSFYFVKYDISLYSMGNLEMALVEFDIII